MRIQPYLVVTEGVESTLHGVHTSCFDVEEQVQPFATPARVHRVPRMWWRLSSTPFDTFHQFGHAREGFEIGSSTGSPVSPDKALNSYPSYSQERSWGWDEKACAADRL